MDTVKSTVTTSGQIDLQFCHINSLKVPYAASHEIGSKDMMRKSGIYKMKFGSMAVSRTHQELINDNLCKSFQALEKAELQGLQRMPIEIRREIEERTEEIIVYIKAGANPNGCVIESKDGNENIQTLLHMAVRCGEPEMVSLLLENGANPNGINSENISAIKLASKVLRWKHVKAFLDSKKSIDKDILGSVLWDAMRARITEASYHSSWPAIDLVNLLLDEGADTNIIIDGISTFHLATSVDDIELVKKFIAKGARVNQESDKGHPLHAAAENNYTEIVKLLLEHKADVGAHNKEKRTAILCAALKRHWQTIKILLDHNIVPDRDSLTLVAGNAVLHLSSPDARDIAEKCLSMGQTFALGSFQIIHPRLTSLFIKLHKRMMRS